MKTLAAYEAEIQQKIASITLLGQLPYTGDDLGVLRARLRELFAVSPTAEFRRACQDFPLALALYLVLEGIHSYNRGEFWAMPDQVLGIGKTAYYYHEEVGKGFRETLHKYDLPTFERLGGHIHITPILAHAGIPNYCLDDFFALLDRAARRRVVVDVPTLMDEWQDGHFPLSIDKPVQRFLLHGGPVAEDFVARCLELWQHDSDLLALDLPRRVLERFEQWRSEQNGRLGVDEKTIRLRSPKLVLDPYGEGVVILLPPVTVSVDSAPRALVWRIETGDLQRTEPTYRRRMGDSFDYTTQSAAVNVMTVAPSYTVTVLADDEELKQWTLRGLGEPALLAFDTDTGELIIDRRKDKTDEYWLSAGERWLVYPRGWTLEAVDAQRRAILPDQAGGWADLAFERWYLEPDAWVEAVGPEGQKIHFRTDQDAPPRRPMLQGEPILTPRLSGTYAVYSGRPPEVFIPNGQGEQSARWRVTVVPSAAAQPPERRSYRLDELPHRLGDVSDGVLLPLAVPELLGDEPFGEFYVRLRGPYGRTADYDLRLIPYLRLRDYPRLYLTDAQGPTEFQVICDPDTQVATGAEADGLEIVSAHKVYPRGQAHTVSAEPALTRVPLRIWREDGAAIDLDVPVYRVRWGLYEPDRPDAFGWQTKPLRLFPKGLESTQVTQIRLDVPLWPGAPEVYCGWQLVDADGEIVQEMPPVRERRPARYYQTRLAEWLDTYQAVGQVASLQLLVAFADGRPTESIPVIYLLPALEVDLVEPVWDIGDEMQQLALFLTPDPPARRRVLRLWSLDRPWQAAPVELTLPDESEGYVEWTLTREELLAGEYWGELAIADPWASEPPTRPEAQADHIFGLCPDAWDELRAKQIAAASVGELDSEPALALLHWACRTDQLADLQTINLGIFRQRAALTVDQLLWWAETIRQLNNSIAYKSVQLALFSKEHLEALGSGAWTAAQVAAFLGHISSDLSGTEIFRIALPLATGDVRQLCVSELCRRGEADGYAALLDDFTAGSVKVDRAVEWLVPEANKAVAWLSASNEPGAETLLNSLLSLHYANDLVRVGAQVLVDTQTVQVKRIVDSRTGADRLICRKKGDPVKIEGILWPDTAKIPVMLDLELRRIHYNRGPLFKCYICGQVYESADRMSEHYRQGHRIHYETDPVRHLEEEFRYLTVISPDR